MHSNRIAKAQLRGAALLALFFGLCLTGRPGGQPTVPHFALQPLGHVDRRLLVVMRLFIEAAYAIPCKIMPPLELPSVAFDAERKQYHAQRLLSFLRKNSPGEAVKVVGVTEEDIYTDRMNFLFGLAELPGRFSVLSTCRFHESFYGAPEKDLLLYRRSLMVLHHELGHTFGLRRCTVLPCAMRYHSSLRQLDASYIWFCPTCRQKLEKLAGPFPSDRDEKLAKLLTAIGLLDDANLHAP